MFCVTYVCCFLNGTPQLWRRLLAAGDLKAAVNFLKKEAASQPLRIYNARFTAHSPRRSTLECILKQLVRSSSHSRRSKPDDVLMIADGRGSAEATVATDAAPHDLDADESLDFLRKCTSSASGFEVIVVRCTVWARPDNGAGVLRFLESDATSSRARRSRARSPKRRRHH